MHRAGQQRKLPIQPNSEVGGGPTCRRKQRGYDEFGIHHASIFDGLPFGAACRADLADGFIDDALDFVWIGSGIALPDALDGALQHAPVHGVLHEFREIAFFHTLSAQYIDT